MGGVTRIMNGAQLPNWVKLVAVGFGLATVWVGQQSAVHELQKGQAQITSAVQELRGDVKELVLVQREFSVLSERVEAQSRRLDKLEASVR